MNAIKFFGAHGNAQHLLYSISCSWSGHPSDLDSKPFLGHPMMNSNLSLALMNKLETVSTRLKANTGTAQTSHMLSQIGKDAGASNCETMSPTQLGKNVDSILVSDDCCQGRLWLIGESKKQNSFPGNRFPFLWFRNMW